ncbi:putative major capsid protein [Sulfolobales Beppu filamentous virus 2]|uniref:Putative major capsid protein n=1 Tax=Sulfolobales Beppu filamentous virus 2 TaxID=2493123 RepID=A0A3Q8Q3S1_9VIRU|nr:putative major capsid protein [Sulfolobales Beppu filamentous virus 2]AZI75801.1 putative major capsid protein [Sulfolobales Beppu filamentous virus 2]
MARKRTSHNDPLRMYEDYVRKLQTMPEAYDISAKYRQANFESGFKALKLTEETFKQYLSQILDELVKQGMSPVQLNFVDQNKVALLKVFTSWLKYSNEKLGNVEIAIELAKTATMTLTENLYGTTITCQDAVDVINMVFNRWVGVEPFEVQEEEGACLVTPVQPIPPVPVPSHTGLVVPLKEVLEAESPEKIIEGTVPGGGS